MNEWTKPSTLIPILVFIIAGAVGYGIIQGNVTNNTDDIAANLSSGSRRWDAINENRDGVSDNKSESRVINQKLKNIEQNVQDIKVNQGIILRAIQNIQPPRRPTE